MAEEHKCYKCGKVIKPGQAFKHLGKLYCCGTCCKSSEKKPANTCEFC